MATTNLQKNIMRRIYYTYVLRTVSGLGAVQIALFAVALYAFAEMVHVHKLIQNMMAVSVGDLPQFILNAFMRGEVLTLIAIGVMAYVSVAMTRRLTPLLSLRFHYA